LPSRGAVAIIRTREPTARTKVEGMDQMAQIDNRYAAGFGSRTGVAVDEGLRAYMLRVYNYMAAGVFLTGLVAYMTASAAITRTPAGGKALTEFGQLIYVSPLKWVIMLAPLGFVFFLSMRIYKMGVGAAQLSFWLFAAAMGLSLSSIFLVYTGQSISQVFFVTAAAFGGLSLYGYTTKRDLSAMGAFLTMGLFGIIIAMLINAFFPMPGLGLAISVLGVLIFAGLTAYDTQKLKNMYFQVAGSESVGKVVIMGALSLYLDFINMFMFLLRFMGDRR
jgi:FtsH-binding integral membrane protein